MKNRTKQGQYAPGHTEAQMRGPERLRPGNDKRPRQTTVIPEEVPWKREGDDASKFPSYLSIDGM